MKTRWSFLMPISAVALLIASAMSAEAQTQSIRFVPEVVGQFNALSRRPDPMGFELYGPDPSQCRHHQALNRTEAADGTPYFLVTRSGPPRDDCFEEIVGIEGNPIANLYIVRMGSRDKNGERLRSNRLRRGYWTTFTPPDPQDKVVRSISYNGPTFESDFPHYDHPGGMQQVGNILAIGVEFPPLIQIVEDPVPIYVPDPTYPPVFVQFLNVTDPENPVVTSRFVPPESGVKAGVVALTPCGAGRVNMPCATGHYLLALSGGSDNGTVHFYESATTETDGSSNTDLSSQSLSWTLMDTWTRDEVIDGGWYAHQTLMFLREGDLGGALYLAGARGGRSIVGSVPDMIDLYRVDLDGDQLHITQVSSRHLISHPAGEGEDAGARLANFAAASTFYVSPSGELIFYASEHDNDGPEGTNGRGSVKMGEWRHIDMVRPDSPTYLPSVSVGGPYVVDEGSTIVLGATGGPPATKASIQLFEDDHYAKRNVVIDFDDWDKDDFDDFKRLDRGFGSDVNGASDEASSWRWFAPVGCTIRANDDDFGDSNFPGSDTRTLSGTGAPQIDPDLHYVVNDTNTGDLNDSFTSAQFFPDCQAYYSAAVSVSWDLNRDGTPETGGNSVSFAATDVDGPAVVSILAFATHPFDGRSGSSPATITVNNVAPSIDSLGIFDGTGHAVPFVVVGQPATFDSTFSDPGRLDRQLASLEWGDGTTDAAFDVFTDAFGGAQGRLRHRHAYLMPGTYAVALGVTDDDGDAAQGGVNISVVTPQQAVAALIQFLDSLISATTNPAARKFLVQARKALAGDVTGFGSNGALHKLAENQDAAAISHMQNALTDLDGAAAAGADVAVLAALIQQAIVAVSAGF